MILSFFSFGTVLSCVYSVTALGSSCSAPLGPGLAGPGEPFWLENIKHQGISVYHPNASDYPVFRNIKDYGAIGDGITDDTVAINNAISFGGRCGGGAQFCNSSTVSPALVYFPKGKYLVSAPLIAYYYTQLVGDARELPTIVASEDFTGAAVIDADPYIPGGNGTQWYINQNNFFRSVRNLEIDLRQVPAASQSGTGIHWQVSQATSLTNIVFHMSTDNDTTHQGIWMENGSGGYMGDLVFNGGKSGIAGGNQQFTVRNTTFNNVQVGVTALWNWGWTFQRVTINNCQVGFNLTTGGLTQQTQSVGAEAIIDARVTNTPVFIQNSKSSNGSLAGSLVLNNVKLDNVPIAVGVLNGPAVLPGGSMTIESWGQGNVYSGSDGTPRFLQDTIPAPHKPSVLLDDSGHIFGKTRPQYESYALSQIINVKDHGAKGDGRTDDTAALQAIFDEFAGCKIIFFDAGTYIVKSTLTIPADSHIVGETWTTIAGRGHEFQNMDKPKPVIRVGEPDCQGIVEISDMIFTAIGPAPGAIIVEWNAEQPSGVNGGTGMWDSHIKIGGSDGTNLQLNCPTRGAGAFIDNCFGAFLGLHLKPSATAYLEGTWVWVADHVLDGDGQTQISIYGGRGILSESKGPVWMIGTGKPSEHFTLYQYHLVNAKNHYMGLIQTETPYYQPNPAVPEPFVTNDKYHDPDNFDGGAWALQIVKSKDIMVFGAGLYSFFRDYEQTCIETVSCQAQIATVDEESKGVHIYSLSTVGTQFQVSLNEQGVVNQSNNPNGFAQTVTYWSNTPSGGN
ncbi:exo-beta-1,3-glucanase [Marasmius fiardii PR-910]|nr:exo-beta-1,3-glucanase [Marasmius fiardii PR-910]